MKRRSFPIANLIDDIANSIRHRIDPTIRLGVTGLSRAGKTVFITALVANLLERDRMLSFQVEAEGRVIATHLAEQPDQTIARFEFEKHLASLLKDNPEWPESTRHISELRLSFKIARKGIGALFNDVSTIHLDIVDYPGEWLLDLALMNKSYAQWSEAILEKLGKNNDYLAQIKNFDGSIAHKETELSSLAESFHQLVRTRHKQGMTDAVPGRFLLPAELEGAPAITFAPLPASKGGRKSAYSIFESRFEAYKKKVIAPFFKNHFAKIDRQVILVDVLGALEKGSDALATLETSMTDILSAFNPGKNGLFSFLLGHKIDKIAFVATKADLLHHYHHERLVDMTRALLKSAERRAVYSGAKTSAKAAASLRATIEDKAKHDGKELAIVRGRRANDQKTIGFHFGDLPDDAESFILGKKDGKFEAPKLSPPDLTNRTKAGLPHIRIDQLAEFLLGDRLR